MIAPYQLLNLNVEHYQMINPGIPTLGFLRSFTEAYFETSRLRLTKQ